MRKAKLKKIETTPALRAIADTIARQLFTNGSGTHADHLEQQVGVPARNLGGWCERAVADLVEDALTGAAIAPPETIARLQRTIDLLEKILIQQGAAVRTDDGQLVAVPR